MLEEGSLVYEGREKEENNGERSEGEGVQGGTENGHREKRQACIWLKTIQQPSC